MILFYKDFILEGTDNSISTPNNIDNLSNNKQLDKEFLKTNKIKAPQAHTLDDVDPTDILDYNTFSKLIYNNNQDTPNYNKIVSTN